MLYSTMQLFITTYQTYSTTWCIFYLFNWYSYDNLFCQTSSK